MIEKYLEISCYICMILLLVMICSMFGVYLTYIATVGVEEAFQRCEIVETKKE